MTHRKIVIATLSAATLFVGAWAQQPAAPPAAEKADPVAAMKQSLQAGMAALRQYEWIETTTTSLKGEEKSKKQNRCYYGASGDVQKVPVGEAPAPEGKSPRGLRGKIVQNKKEDISEAMQEAVALVKAYVPPDPAKIQAAKDAGRVAVNPPDAKGHARAVISDYLKPGDSLSVDMDMATSHITGLTVATFTDKKDPVGLNVSFGTFPDGGSFPAKIALKVEKESMDVVIENTGHRKAGS